MKLLRTFITLLVVVSFCRGATIVGPEYGASHYWLLGPSALNQVTNVALAVGVNPTNGITGTQLTNAVLNAGVLWTNYANDVSVTAMQTSTNFTLVVSNSTWRAASLTATNHAAAVLQSATNYANSTTNASIVRQTQFTALSNAVVSLIGDASNSLQIVFTDNDITTSNGVTATATAFTLASSNSVRLVSGLASTNHTTAALQAATNFTRTATNGFIGTNANRLTPAGGTLTNDGNTRITGDSTVLGSLTASNFAFFSPRWTDAVANGYSFGAGNNAPSLIPVSPGSFINGYAYGHGDDFLFGVQTIHKLAETNATFPNFYFEPRIHITPTSFTTGTNATFWMQLQCAPAFLVFTNAIYSLTNTVSCTNLYSHTVLSFGNITNNTLQGKSSVIFKAFVERLNGGAGDMGVSSTVIVDSADIHIPFSTFGSSGQFGD